MADTKEIKAFLTKDKIYNLLEELGLEPRERNNNIECLTLCHGGDSHKLMYYASSELFMCYTNCGSMDIFSLLQKVLDKSFIEIIHYLTDRFGIGSSHFGEFAINSSEKVINPIDKLNKQINRFNEKIKIPKISESILNTYYENYYQGWIDEGISIGTMKKFEIKYNLLENQIIIPQRDISGALIGVRARNLNKILIDEGKKYIPAFFEKKALKFPTGMNLYGAYQNERKINQTHRAILFEAEKSVLKLDSMNTSSIGLAISGSNLTDTQVELLNRMDISEVVIGMDKEFTDEVSEKNYARKIYSNFEKLKARYNVSILWDTDDLLKKQDSPVDRGESTFKKLLQKRIYI